MSLLYFDGMDQYAAVAEPSAGTPVTWTAGSSPSTLIPVATDPSIYIANTAVCTFQKHLANDRTYIALGTNRAPDVRHNATMNANGVCTFVSTSANSGLDSFWTSVQGTDNGHNLTAPDTVANMTSWTVGFKLKFMTSHTTSSAQTIVFGDTLGMPSATCFGITIELATGNVYIRAQGGQGLLDSSWSAGTFTDAPVSGLIGTTNFVWAACNNSTAPLTVANMATNTIEVTLYDTGRVGVWINNLYVGAATFTTPTIVRNCRYARLGLGPAIRGPFTTYLLSAVSDLYTLNGLGTRNTSRLGKVKVVSRQPKTDVAVQFQRPDNANTNAEVAAQSPAKVTPSLTGLRAGDKDIYASTAFNFTNEAIVATAITTTGYKTDPTGNDIAPVLRVGSTDYVGNSNALPVSTTQMKQDQHIYEVNPATGQTFTKTDLDATRFGVVVVAPGT